jgi:hypothetical protein
MLNDYSLLRVRRWKIDNREIVRTSETTLDRNDGLATVEYTIEELNDDGVPAKFRESHVNRFFSVDEMQTLLTGVNFKPVKFFAGFNQTEPITNKTWHVVAVAQKS